MSMRKSILAVAVAATAFLAIPVASVAADNEVSGSLSYNDINDVTLTTAELSYGRYLTEQHEVGLTTSYMRLKVSGEGSLDGNELGAFYHLNFPMEGSVTPYLGVQASWIGGDLGDAYDFTYGVGGGFKIFPYEHAGFIVSAAYQKLKGAHGYKDANGTTVNAGLVVRF
jgi:hypothetical protein